MKPHSPYPSIDPRVNPNFFSRFLRKIGYELKPNEGSIVSQSYRDYYHSFSH